MAKNKTLQLSFIGGGMIAVDRGNMKYALPLGSFLAVGAVIAPPVGYPPAGCIPPPFGRPTHPHGEGGPRGRS